MDSEITQVSPVGCDAVGSIRQRLASDPHYAAQWEALAEAREVAWQIVKYRMDHGLTQHQLAARVGTSHSQISRIESGRHKASMKTLRRIGDALGLKLVIIFEPKDTAAIQEPHVGAV